MIAEITRFIPHLVVGLLALSLLLFLVSLQQLRRGRTGPYWRLRRSAGQRGGRLFLLSVALFGLALAIAFFSGFARIALRGAGVAFVLATDTPVPTTEIPTRTPLPTLTPTFTDTPAPSFTPTHTPTPTATPTMTFTPTITFTASPTFETALHLATLPGGRAPRASATIRMNAADTQVSPDGAPVEPRVQFEAGVQRLFFFFGYQNMMNGVAWSRVLYRDGVAVQGGTFLWSLGESGSGSFFFGDSSGYPPGEYRVEIRLENRITDTFSFTIFTPDPP